MQNIIWSFQHDSDFKGTPYLFKNYYLSPVYSKVIFKT